MVKTNSTSNGSGLTNTHDKYDSFGIYIHVPFCVHKCSYCDFYSFTQYQAADFEPYVSLICQEIEQASQWLGAKHYKKNVSSVFFGGGTPSLLPPLLIRKILKTVSQQFELQQDVEITTEANPETLSLEYLQELKELTPINRVSMGGQSFNSENLKKLERLGSAQSILEAAEFLEKVGYCNWNLDLIFAIPGQDEVHMVDDLNLAAKLNPSHLSAYNLTLKPGHALYSQLPTDDAVALLYEKAVEILKGHGFQQYEISNYAKTAKDCVHNLLYWAGGDFLGLGPSASSRFFWNGVFHHRKQFSDYSRYKSGNFTDVPFEGISLDETQLEATFLEIRRNAGIHLSNFKKRYAFDPSQSKSFSLLLKEKLMIYDGEILKLTDRGRLLADMVTQRLVE